MLLHLKKSIRCLTYHRILAEPEPKPNPCSPRPRSTLRVTSHSWASHFHSSTTSQSRDARQNVLLDRGENKNSTLDNPTMVGGQIHPFALSFTNPVHDPTQIQPNDLWLHPPTTTTAVPADESRTTPRSEKRHLTFVITLPTFTFSVIAFAEAWEYDEDGGDMVGDECTSWVDDRR